MSGASSRRKGNRAEVEVVRVLREAGYEAETSRSIRGGTQGGADIISDFPAAIEVKNQTRLDLAGWWAQAEEQANGRPAVVVHKRVGKAHAEDWWVTMDLKTLLRLLGPEALACVECQDAMVPTDVWLEELGMCLDCSNDYWADGDAQ